MLVRILLYLACFALVRSETKDTPTTWKWYKIPNPQTEPVQCGRLTKSWVCDPNGLLSYNGANEIDRQIKSVMIATDCPCGRICRQDSAGYMISVLVVPEFQTPYTGSDRYELTSTARRFLYAAYKRQWHFARCGEFVVIFYAKNQNLLYTMTGAKARALMPDSTVEEISIDVMPNFVQGESQNITAGLLQMIAKYKDLLVYSTQNDAPLALPLTGGGDDQPSNDNVVNVVSVDKGGYSGTKEKNGARKCVSVLTVVLSCVLLTSL